MRRPRAREAMGGLAAGVLAGAALIPTGCSWLEGASSGAAIGVATRHEFRSVIEATGALEAAVSTQLGPPSIPDTWSYNLTFMAPEGKVVRKGEVVMRFDGTQIEDRLRETQADYETAVKEREKEEKSLEVEVRQLDLDLVEARSDLKRAELEVAVPDSLLSSIEAEELRLAERLAEDKVGFLESKIAARKDQVAAQLKLLDVKRQRAEQRIAYYTDALSKFDVRAPSDGVIVYVRKRDGGRWEVGESVWMLAKVIEVADLSTLRVSAQLLEVDAARVRPGQPVSVWVDAIPGRVWKSRVDEIGKLVRPRSQQDRGKVFDVYVPLDEIDSKTMRPGMSVRVEIEEQVLPDALTIPVTAVREHEGRTTVLVEGADGPEERTVTVGPRNHEQIVVVDGLEEGEKVL